MNRYEFEILAYIEEHGKKEYTWRELVNELNISGDTILKNLDSLKKEGLLKEEGKNESQNQNETQNGKILSVTEKGLEALEPYRVKRAVIFAAGFGSRMVPVTLKTPKPMVKVNGIRIIDRLIDAMIAKDITDITIVRGYLKERFEELKEKYPSVQLIDNDLYEKENNISSALAAIDKIDECYICAGDLLVSNPDIIKKYHYRSNYLGSFSLETDDWCFDFVNGFAANYRKGGTYCFNQYEIAYWNKEDSKKMREDMKKAYLTEGGKDLFWEFIPLVLCKEHYQVEIRQCAKSDIIEIDNFSELVQIDSGYADYKAE